MYRESLLTSMGMFDDKRGHFGGKYSSGPSFVKFNRHFDNKQTHCKL